ncbi:MAG TPA: DUF4177 domain-containing protein [Gemmatimonadales bacterium]|jgi:hypothetical protein
MYEYKVVVQKHRTMLSGRFDHDDLEALLNNEALEGWVFDGFVDPGVAAIMENGREVHLLVFRRRRE